MFSSSILPHVDFNFAHSHIAFPLQSTSPRKTLKLFSKRGFDIKIFVHADSDERLIRRLQRDTQERGHDLKKVLTRYQTAVKPMHLQFIEPSKEFADIIIPNNHYNTVAVDIVRTIINNNLS